MKRLNLIATLALVIVGSAALIASAQMMNMTGTNSPHKDKAATSVSGNADLSGMMQQISTKYRTMAGDFTKLEQHFETMLKMNNMKELKQAMKEHRDMMTAMHDQMTNNYQMYTKMMAMMQSSGTNGQMMGANGTQDNMMGSKSGMQGQMMGANSTGQAAPGDKSH